MGKVCIVGSLNMDMVVNVKNLPVKGETVLAHTLKKIPGGKGANQAVAACRLGANVCMIGKVGDDSVGEILRSNLQKEGINTEYIFTDSTNPTGLAIIPVDEDGSNSIMVVPGSNMNITIEEIKRAQGIIKSSDVVAAQFETPLETTAEAFRIAKKYGVLTILNPAPAREIPSELMRLAKIIVPNETEAYEITKVKIESDDSARAACKILLDRGAEYVIITLGEKGAVVAAKDGFERIPAYKVPVVDTTAAGDGFIGAISARLHEGKICFKKIREAVEFANKVSSIVVQRRGAQPSLPYLKEIS